MAIDEESTFSTYMQELSAGLAAAAAANAECMMPSGADMEMKKLSESILQIPNLSNDHAKAKQRMELEEIIYEVEGLLQLFSLKGGSDKVSANHTAILKLHYFSSNIRCGTNQAGVAISVYVVS